MNKSGWYRTIEFINTLEDGEEFNTRLMYKYVRNFRPSYSATRLFWNRVILEKLGFLKQIKSGIWRKDNNFPEHIGRNKAEKVAWSKLPWQAWFIPPGWIVEGKTQKSRGVHGGCSSNL
jgi:hypothetical protein